MDTTYDMSEIERDSFKVQVYLRLDSAWVRSLE